MSSGIVNRLEYAALHGFLGLCRVLPLRAALWMGRAIGDILFDVVRIRRQVTCENLKAAFPEKNDTEIKKIARSTYRNFSMTAVRFGRLPIRGGAGLLDRTEIDHPEYIDAAASIGKGVIVLTGHFGTWEHLAAIFPAKGFPTWLLVGEQRNRLVEEQMDRVRMSVGSRILSAERDLRGVIETLNRGEILVIAGDQDAGRDGVFVDFLGRPASTAVGPVRLARRFGVPILLGFALATEDERMKIELKPPFVVPKSGDESEVIQTYTEKWSAVLEEYVRRYPEHWFWMHRRWKTRPESVRHRKEGRL